MDINCHSTTCNFALDAENFSDQEIVFNLYRSIKDGNLHHTSHVLDYFPNVNVPLLKVGWYAGYTALHIACMVNNLAAVELLITDYCANMDLEAEDGARPIHLASLLGHLDIVEVLLQEGAEVDAKFEREVCGKWKNSRNWIDGYGPEVTLLTWAVVNDLEDLAILLINHGANLKVRNQFDKTLLMVAIENNNYMLAVRIIRNLNDREFINARDSEGIPATHYLLHESKYGGFQYDPEQSLLVMEKASTLKHLMSAGADIDALINDNPDTLLLNLAAYRANFLMVDLLLPYQSTKENCKALYNASFKSEETKRVRINYRIQYDYDPFATVKNCRDASVKYILKSIVQRCALGAFVPPEERKLMEEYVKINPSVKQFVEDYFKQFIEGVLKDRIIEYGDQKISFYDFAVKVFNNRTLKPLARDRVLVDSFRKIYWNKHFYHLERMVKIRIAEAEERVQLLERLKKVPQLKACIPLPFECVLEIIEFMSNSDLKVFIDSFYLYCRYFKM